MLWPGRCREGMWPSSFITCFMDHFCLDERECFMPWCFSGSETKYGHQRVAGPQSPPVVCSRGWYWHAARREDREQRRGRLVTSVPGSRKRDASYPHHRFNGHDYERVHVFFQWCHAEIFLWYKMKTKDLDFLPDVKLPDLLCAQTVIPLCLHYVLNSDGYSQISMLAH